MSQGQGDLYWIYAEDEAMGDDMEEALNAGLEEIEAQHGSVLRFDNRRVRVVRVESGAAVDEEWDKLEAEGHEVVGALLDKDMESPTAGIEAARKAQKRNYMVRRVLLTGKPDKQYADTLRGVLTGPRLVKGVPSEVVLDHLVSQTQDWYQLTTDLKHTQATNRENSDLRRANADLGQSNARLGRDNAALEGRLGTASLGFMQERGANRMLASLLEAVTYEDGIFNEVLSAYVTATVGSALILNGDEEVIQVGDTLYHDATTGLAHRSSLVGLDRLLGGEAVTSHDVSLQATKFEVGTDTYTVVSANENQYPSANVALAALESVLTLRGKLQSTADDWMDDGDFAGLAAAADYTGEDVAVTEFTAYDALQLVKKQFPGSLDRHGDLSEYQGVPIDASNEDGGFETYLGALADHFRSYGVNATPTVELRHGDRGVEIDFVVEHRKIAYSSESEFASGMETLKGPLSIDVGKLSFKDKFHFGQRGGTLRIAIRDANGELADDLFDAYARIPGEVGEGNKLTAPEYANPVLSRRRMRDLKLAFNPVMKTALGYESFGTQGEFLRVLMDGKFAPQAHAAYTLSLYKPGRQ
jgi:hypothetical protein